MSGLNQLNQRLANVGMPTLNAQSAAQLKQVAQRDRVLNALARVESHNDNGARAFLDKAFKQIAPQANEVPVQQAPTPKDPIIELMEAGQQKPQSPAGTAPANNGVVDVQRRDYIQHHVYGGRAALTFDLDKTKSGIPTVALDGAASLAPREYDWSNKIRVQFTVGELPVVAATLLGMLPVCRFSNHGPENNKGFSIEWQGERSSFFVSLWHGKGNARSVPMTREDAFYAAQILIRAIQQASPARMDTTGVIATLRAMYARR